LHAAAKRYQAGLHAFGVQVGLRLWPNSGFKLLFH
jgi:hypothetical protein